MRLCSERPPDSLDFGAVHAILLSNELYGFHVLLSYLMEKSSDSLLELI